MEYQVHFHDEDYFFETLEQAQAFLFEMLDKSTKGNK